MKKVCSLGVLVFLSFSLMASVESCGGEKCIKCFNETSLLKSYASGYFVRRSQEAILDHGSFVVALSGGSMPKLLSDLTLRTEIQWEKVYILFADERCCPLDDDDSNFKACNNSLFSHIPIPRENILTIEHYDNPVQAAQAYESRLLQVLDGRTIDMILLGLGPDGHTASLFPNHELLQYSGDQKVVPIFDSPKPPSRRITLTLSTINSSREVVFIATGEGKAQRLKDILSPEDPEPAVVYPPTLVRPVRVSWLVDTPAASLITTHPHMEIINESFSGISPMTCSL